MSINKVTDITPEDYEKALEIFRQLPPNSVWHKVEHEDFVIRRFDFGFVNNILCCELTESALERLKPWPNDPIGVVIKFLKLKDSFLEVSPVDFGIINTLVSERGLGPRLLFTDGDVYVHELAVGARNWSYDDDNDEETVKACGRFLARYHSMNVPVSLAGYQNYCKLSDDWESMTWSVALRKGNHFKVLEEFPDLKEKYSDLLNEADLFAERKNLDYLIKSIHSPLVFSHTDFNRGNRLIRRTINPSNGKEQIDIFLVDLDYSNYNSRGIDLGRYFSNYRHHDSMFGNEGFPTDEEMKLFLEAYHEECVRLLGDKYLADERNSIENLIIETKIFTLQAYYIDFYFSIGMLATSKMDHDKVAYFLTSFSQRYAGYKSLFNRFIDEKVFDRYDNK